MIRRWGVTPPTAAHRLPMARPGTRQAKRRMDPRETAGATDAARTDPSDAGAGEGSASDAGARDASADDGGPASVDAGSDAACTGEAHIVAGPPLDMYIMLDQSGSMTEEVDGGTKWTAVTAALTGFVADPSAAGISVGLGYFGLPPASPGGCVQGAACTSSADCNGGTCGPITPTTCLCPSTAGDSCSAADYAKPDVEIAPLPGIAASIRTSIAAHSPTTGTPTSAALQGALDHADAWATAHTGHRTIVVFATDGDPSECDTNITNISAIAAQALARTPSVSTFVIGIGASLGNLNAIAQAGGTSTAFLVDTSGNASAQLALALNKIRGTAQSCAYPIPVPSAGPIDFARVNVEYTPSAGVATVIPQVHDKTSCPTAGGAWYYDDLSAPKQVVLCDTSCAAVRKDVGAVITVVTGCGTTTL